MNRCRTLTYTLCAAWTLAWGGSHGLLDAAEPPQPNILWITCEDIGPHLSCYGDSYADTPTLDTLASRGTIYLHAWSNAPVCAPARTTIISGMYPPATGSEHMRSITNLPPGMKFYPQVLREAGYYCTNNSKTDYNLQSPGKVWDESSGKAHWKNRKPGQPFFAIFNFTVTHESRIRRRPHELVHDPAKAPLPAYHPDTPESRRDWAQYYDNITTMDGMAARRLKELDAAGVADDTIVFFYGDHGSGMPRAKRSPHDSGLLVPMIVYIPQKFRHLASDDYRSGGKSERLVSFVDLGPTVISLAGVQPPEHMHGLAFLGEHEAPPRSFMYGFRGRMDERYDLVRCVRDKRYVYLRNYMPHLPDGQHVAYQFQTPTTAVWWKLFTQGKVTPEQAQFWQRKAPECLYDLERDSDEVHNLADSPKHQAILQRMRAAEQQWVREIRDVGFLPEAEIHSRAAGSSPYEVGHDAQFPLERIIGTAELASSLKPEAVDQLRAALDDPDSAVRYWAAMGFLMRGRPAVAAAADRLRAALRDPSPSVQIIAAWALGQYGREDDLQQALPVLLSHADYNKSGCYLPLLALNALDYLDEKAASVLDQLQALPKQVKPEDRRKCYGIPAVTAKMLSDLQQ